MLGPKVEIQSSVKSTEMLFPGMFDQNRSLVLSVSRYVVMSRNWISVP